MPWRVEIWILLACMLQACVPVYVPLHYKLPLEEPGAPVVAPHLIAAGDAQPISMLRSGSSSAGQSIFQGTHSEGGTVGGGPGGGFILILIENRTFEPEVSPAIWVSDGLRAGLENAGYRVEMADSLADARTPLAISVALTSFTAEETGGMFDAKNLTCTGRVGAEITLMRRGAVEFDRTYQGVHQERTFCEHVDALSFVMRKALENLLDQALPELAEQLARPAPAVAKAGQNAGAGH